jgi:hypothetical protein
MGLSEPEEMTDSSKKTLSYYGLCPFSVHYESVMFYSAGSKGCLSLKSYNTLLLIMTPDANSQKLLNHKIVVQRFIYNSVF